MFLKKCVIEILKIKMDFNFILLFPNFYIKNLIKKINYIKFIYDKKTILKVKSLDSFVLKYILQYYVLLYFY